MEKSKTKTESRLRIIEDYYTIIIQIEEIVVEKAYLVCKNDNLLPRTTISKFFFNFKEKQNGCFFFQSLRNIYTSKENSKETMHIWKGK